MKKSIIDYEILYKIASEGYTLAEIADVLGVSDRTIYAWIKEIPKFSQTLKMGKHIADKRVEDSLYKRALGYEYTEVKTEDVEINTANESIKLPAQKITRTKKLIVPDVTAQIFWLKNRKPDEWRDKREVEQSGELTHNLKITENDIDDRKKLINQRFECTN